MKKIIIGILIILMLLFPNIEAKSNYYKSNCKNIKFNDIEFNNLGEKLILKNVYPILKGYFFIKNYEIKQIIRKTIFEIIFTGDATIDEIQNFIDLTSISVENIYLLPKIKTTDTTDGLITCRPGDLLAYFVGYFARGSYVRIDEDSWSSFGWHIEIDGEKTERINLQIFGFYGYIKSFYEIWIPPGDYDSFELDGSAVMILEVC